MDGQNVFWFEFLEIYKSLPVLWNVYSENYSNRVAKAAAYNKLVNKLKEIDPDANKEKVTRKIHIFRTNYRRELRKVEKCKAAGAGNVTTLWYFDLLHFLTDEDDQSNAKSTMSDDDSVSDGSNDLFEAPVKRNTVKEDEFLEMACEQLIDSNDAVLEKVWVSQDADNVFWYEFLEMYKSLPVLWKVKSEKYCNRMEKEAAYAQLVDKLKEIDSEANRDKVSKKLHNFRSNYRRELRKVKKSKVAGADNVPTVWYFDLLQFLSDQEVHGKRNNNMNGDNNMSDRSDEVVEPSVKRKQVKEDGIVKMACEQLKDSNDAVMEKVWVSQDADNIFWYEFLEIYKSLPILWNVYSENYCNRVETDAAYDKLVDKLKEIDPKANKAKVIKKLHTFRSNYRRELKKLKGRDDESTLWYFDLLHFLTDQDEQSKTKSTMSDEESNDDISVLAEGWASKYAELGYEQRVLANRIWADVLFHGCMDRLTKKMVEDVHHVLKGTSNTSTPTPTSPPSSTPYYEEYSYSPQQQFTFVAYEQNDETPPVKGELCDELRQNPLTDVPSTSTTHSLLPRSLNTNNEVIERSSSTPSIDNENQNDFNNSYEIKEKEEYEDISYEVTDDDDDVLGSIDHEDDSVVEINNKILSQNQEENRTRNAANVAVNILNRIQVDKLKSDTRRKHINRKKLSDDERRELKRLRGKRDCVCDQCGRHFTNTSNFKLHLLRHTGIKNYECEVCNAKFYAAHLLKRHSLIHSNSPPMIACKYCDKTFIYNNLRLRHERAHFRERQFKCQYCDKLSFSRRDQQDHELVHTQNRKYYCELCNHYSLRRTHLEVHYRSKAHKNKEQQKK